MKKTLYSLSLGLACLASVSVSAQNSLRVALPTLGQQPEVTKGRPCATMDVLNAQLAADPAMATRMASIEAQTNRFLSNGAAQRTAATVSIPVVVHVLYNTSAQNVSD